MIAFALTAVLATLPDLADGAALARAVAEEYAAVTRGIATFIVTTLADVRGGPMHSVENSLTVYLAEDGATRQKRVLRDVKNGKALAQNDLDRLSSALDGPLSRFGMHAPFQPAALADYRFAPPQVEGDLVRIDFISLVRDAAHGDGSLFYARDAGRIDRVTYTPAALPHDSGSVVLLSAALEIVFGPVSPSRWDIVKIVRTFTGRDGPMRGHGVVTSVYDHYHTHANFTEAVAELQTSPER
jgi:hypothetical protein